MTQPQRIQVWDLPTRLFHWLLAATVVGAVITAEIGGNAMECHGRLGLAAIGLIVFRLVWGLAGSTYARFAQFFPRPALIQAYLKGQWQGVGHNPLGALAVFALLLLVAAQAVTGLFANDDISYRGYLYALGGGDLSDRLTGLHKLLSDFLIILVALHVAAIAFYLRVRKTNLVRPMITGWQEAKATASTQPVRHGSLVALILALVLAGIAVYGASGAWLPAPPPAAASPSW